MSGPDWLNITAAQERYINRVRAALEDFHAGRMTASELQAYLFRISGSPN